MSCHWAVNTNDSVRATCCDMADIAQLEAIEAAEDNEASAIRGLLVALPVSLALWMAFAALFFV
tara:strand:+ start:494 stop:685 length:192 start_codon:yes stop_codon:yes gene_type:complete